MNSPEKIASRFVIASRDRSILLELGKKVFNQMQMPASVLSVFIHKLKVDRPLALQ